MSLLLDVIELTATLDGVKPFQEDTAIHPKESPPLGIVNEENSDGDKADKIPIDSFYTRHDDEERPPKAQQPELVVHRSDAFDLGDLQTVLEEDIWSRLNSSKDLSHQRGTEDEPQAKQFTPNTCEEGLVSSSTYKLPAELWAVVFRYCVDGDIEEYLGTTGASTIYSFALKLSHVCSFWRRIAHAERDLWRYFIWDTQKTSAIHHVELLEQFISLNPRSLTFMATLGVATKESTPLPAESMASCFLHHSIYLVSRDPDLLFHPSVPFKGQESLTLHIHHSPPVELIDKIHQPFSSLKRITIICSQHISSLHTSIWRRDIPVLYLKLDLTRFTSFSITHVGNAGLLEEFHVLHYGLDRMMPTFLAYVNLRVLGLTPPDTTWLPQVCMPSLRSLTLYGPKYTSIGAPSLVQLSQHRDFHRIKELELHSWPMYRPIHSPSWSVMPLVLNVADQLRGIETVRCVNSFIEGDRLVTLIKELKGNIEGQEPPRIRGVVINSCSGITQNDCDAMATCLEKLVIYI